MGIQKYTEILKSLEPLKLDKLKEIVTKSDNIIILGNGGSNAISCHIAQDYTNVLRIPTLCFGDAARLSCYANDFGWDKAYAQYLQTLANKNTLVILISSSGNSKNMINAAEYCRGRNNTILLTGFSNNNMLRSVYAEHALLEFWIDSTDYGVVENTHQIILHSVI